MKNRSRIRIRIKKHQNNEEDQVSVKIMIWIIFRVRIRSRNRNFMRIRPDAGATTRPGSGSTYGFIVGFCGVCVAKLGRFIFRQGQATIGKAKLSQCKGKARLGWKTKERN
eukprot:gb/GEZN01014951.1/.p1 GENE.gb/GEZN01014951.1/~~gb/GEZN01014951.1/.p1  ORF type:complete len:111 (+),score=3.04 gb/GEZN01014951.1/:433-765(+)